MSIKNLQNTSALPQDIRKKIESVLQTRNNASHFPLLKGNEYIWGIWEYGNRDFTTWCAKLIASYFFLSYIQLLEEYLEIKYSKISKVSTNENMDLDINIKRIQTHFQDKLSEDDHNWINQDVLMPIGRVITCITSDNITSLNDLVSLSNLGNKQIDILTKYPEKDTEREYQLKESLLTYIDNLIQAKFIDQNQWKIQSLEKVEDFKIYGELLTQKYGMEVSLHQSESKSFNHEVEKPIKGISVSEEITNLLTS